MFFKRHFSFSQKRLREDNIVYTLRTWTTTPHMHTSVTQECYYDEDKKRKGLLVTCKKVLFTQRISETFTKIF